MMSYQNPSCSPKALAVRLTKDFGRHWVDYEQETLEDMVGKIHPVVMEKIRAIRVCNASTLPWESFEAFSPVAQAFNGMIPSFNKHIELSAGQLAIAAYALSSLRKESFEKDIPRYFAACMMHQGIHFCVHPLLEKSKPFIRPYDSAAEAKYSSLKEKSLEEVELEETPEGVQVALALAENHLYKTTVDAWEREVS